MDILLVATVFKRELIKTVSWILDTEGMMFHDDETMMTWKVLRTPLLLFGLIALWVGYQLTSCSGLIAGQLPFGLHRWFLYFNVVCLMVNINLLLSTMCVWFSHSKLLRCLTFGIDDDSDGRSQVTWLFCIIKTIHIVNLCFKMLRHARGYERILMVFHIVLKPAMAWVCLKYWITEQQPWLAVFMSICELSVYFYYLSSYYFQNDHPFRIWVQRSQLIICLLEVGEASAVVYFGVSSFYDKYDYSIAFLLWMCGYGLTTLILLLITFRKMTQHALSYNPTCFECALDFHHKVCETLK